MAAVDSFSLLLREIGRSCNCYMETLAFIGALYTAKTCFTFANDTYTLIRLHFIPRLISRADLVKLYGKWAVVTGCTSGIGKSYAKELASHGVNIILISRNKEKLEALAKEIVDAYKVETAIIVIDFGEGREIYPAVKKALMGKEIGILVNNVGVFYNHPDYFANLTQDKIWELINVNIGAVNMMVHMVLPGMVERKKGAVVNVSSIFCCQPTPQMTAYSASKAYLDHFSRALHYEYAPKGIFVQSLIPFFIAADTKSKCFFVPSAEEYAHHAVTTLGISKRTTGYWLHSILDNTYRNGSGPGDLTELATLWAKRPPCKDFLKELEDSQRLAAYSEHCFENPVSSDEFLLGLKKKIQIYVVKTLKEPWPPPISAEGRIHQYWQARKK